MNQNNQPNRLKLIIASAVVFVLAILIVTASYFIIDSNVTVVIRNADQYMNYLSNNDKRGLHNSFSSFVKGKFELQNAPEDVYIRDGSFEMTEKDGLKTANFIVDIDSLKISYRVTFSSPYGSHTQENPIIDCPSLSETKYPETECVGMTNSSSLAKAQQENPIYSVLPITVNEYDKQTHVTTRFDIFGYFDSENDNKFTVNIVDYSCNNREKALQAIRDKGFDPNKYTINYQDECYKKHLPHTGTNSLGDKYRISVTETEDNGLYFLIDNFTCNNKAASETATINAVTDWLLLRNLTLSNYEYGILTFCERY